MSNSKYIKIDIDTVPVLDCLAEEYDMPVAQLVSFHNQHCDFGDRLLFGLPQYIRGLCLPAEKYEARQSRRLKDTLLALPDLSSRQWYGMIVRHEPKELKIHYRIHVERNAKQVRLHKQQTFVNNSGVDKIVEQLVEKAAQALYPLEISLDRDGEMSHVANISLIKKRWEASVYPDLQRYYESEVAQKALRQIHKAYMLIGPRSRKLRRNLFFNLYFLPIYESYPNFTKEGLVEIYFSSLDKTVSFHVEYVLKSDYTADDKISLRIQGSEKQIDLTDHPPSSRLVVDYRLHKESRLIYSFQGYALTTVGKKEYKVHFQLFEQKTEEV